MPREGGLASLEAGTVTTVLLRASSEARIEGWGAAGPPGSGVATGERDWTTHGGGGGGSSSRGDAAGRSGGGG